MLTCESLGFELNNCSKILRASSFSPFFVEIGVSHPEAFLSISFSLFGYVYVLTRASFHYQSQNLIELGQNLGFSKFKSFFKIILPSARPAIVAGLALVAMETLSDFGAVSFFGIATLTTGIYDSWISFDDLAFANQLSFFLLLFILGLFFIENISRKKAQYHSPVKGGIKEKKKI